MFQWLARLTGNSAIKGNPAKPPQGEESKKQVTPGPTFGPVSGIPGIAGGLPKPHDRTIQTWRLMRAQPTIALSRAIATGPIRSAEYAVESEDGVAEDRTDFVDETMKPLWRDLMRNLIYGLDYGWQGFEKVYGVDGGRQVITKLKMLLPDITYVLLDKETGQFMGVSNGKKMMGYGFNAGAGVVLPPEKVFWYSHNKEGDYWYGESVMERARADYNRWNAMMVKAEQYYTTIAGAIPILEYPEGESVSAGGSTINNYQIALQILQSLKNALGVAVPGMEAAYYDAITKQGIDPTKISAWKLNMFEAKSRHGPEFEAGLTAREKGMIRSWLLPERAVAEGIHGTKAEAETQTETAMVSLDTILQDMLDAINKWVINPLLVLNYGEEAKNTVWLVVEKQDPRKAELLRQIVMGIFGAPINADLFEDTFNLKTVFELLDLPLVDDFESAMADKKERDDKNRETQAATAAAMAANAGKPVPPPQPPPNEPQPQ